MIKTRPKTLTFETFSSTLKFYKEKAAVEPRSVTDLLKVLNYAEEKKNESQIKTSFTKYLKLVAQLWQDLASFAIEDADSVREKFLEKNFRPELARLDSPTFIERLHLTTYEHYQMIFDSTSELNQETAFLAEIRFKLAAFLDKYIRECELQSQFASKTHEELAHVIVENVMGAMAGNSLRAMDRFPRLLELIELYPATHKAFKAKAPYVPSWMYIRWISQILALFDKPQAPSIADILVRLSEDFPGALYYPFKISSEDLDTSKIKKFGVEEKYRQIQKNLHNPRLDLFVCALCDLTFPELRFKDILEPFRPLLKDPPSQRSSSTKAKLLAMMKETIFELFTIEREPAIGAKNKEFAKNYGGAFASAFGRSGEAVADMTDEQFRQALTKIGMTMTASGRLPVGKQELGQMSQWLSNFEQSEHGSSQDVIEVPGQYGSLTRRPDPQSHISISSFGPQLLVMSSMRRPKRLIMYGDNEKEYKFLVKGGEDLRMDQRIQQLFSIMNQVLATDIDCRKRRLFIKTYEVIPMSNKVGIIEWVNDTMPMKEMIDEQFRRYQRLKDPKKPVVDSASRVAYPAYGQWMDTFLNYLDASSRKKVPPNYQYMCNIQYGTADKVIPHFSKLQEMIPADLLRGGILSLAATPEAYILIRNEFAKSLAVFNIASYILGIGDRHLDNFLIDLTKGTIVGIDFGHAFGSAVQFLPVPELMPFRLTRQLTGFLQPLDHSGLLKYNMIYSMRAFQENKEILLNTMNVFIKEPLLDWRKNARKIVKDQQGQTEDTIDIWFPQKKMEIVKKKLSRHNPALITLQEFQEGIYGNRDKIVKAARHILLGSHTAKSTPCARLRAKEVCASIQEQVDCLIEQASDPNILGRTWTGWAPYV